MNSSSFFGFLRFSLKKALISPVFLIFLLLCAALPPLTVGLGEKLGSLPAGYISEAPEDAASERIAAMLDSFGWQRCADEAALRAAVTSGAADCGAIIPAVSRTLAEDGPEAVVLVFIAAEDSLLAPLRREQAAAALFAAAAPYITADALREAGAVLTENDTADGASLSLQEVFLSYDALQAQGVLFRFETETLDGPVEFAADRVRRYLTGALALFVSAACFFGVTLPLTEDHKRLSARCGRRVSRRTLLFPGLLVRALLLLTAAGCGLLAVRLSLRGGAAGLSAAFSGLFPALCLFLPSQLFGSLLLLKLLPHRDNASTAALLLLIPAAALCPVFADLSLFFPPIRFLRLFCPPYWLWVFAGLF